jgi:uncharacterized membrane protein
MYKIIGADQKQYGPITGDQILQWISESRVNAQTQARGEGDQEWKSLSEFPEFADALGASSAAPPPFAGGGPDISAVSAEEILARDYTLDIGNCLTRGWALVKKNFWPLVGVSFLVMLVMGGINQLIGLFSRPAINEMILEHRFSPRGIAVVLFTTILSGPIYAVLTAGLFKYYLKLIRGEQAGVGDAFSGFGSSIGQLALLGLLQCLLVDVGIVLCIVPGIYLAVAWYFSVPLVIDRQLPFWAAMELSRKVVSRHWFIVFGFLLVMGLVAASGIIACCVGVFVTIPIGFAALMYAYEDIFGRRTG